MSAKRAMQFLSVGLVLLFLFISIFIGILISYKKADSDDLKQLRDSLSMKKERLAFKHDLNNLKRTNAQYFDKYHIMLDNQDLDKKLDLLTIANATRRPCERGEINGCWMKEIDVYKNEVVAVQIHYYNASPVTLDRVSFGITRQYTPNSIKMEITAMVKDKIIAKDIVKAYFHECNRFNILEGEGIWTTEKGEKFDKHFDEIKFLMKDRNFPIGDLGPYEQGSVITRFKAVLKE